MFAATKMKRSVAKTPAISPRTTAATKLNSRKLIAPDNADLNP